jgi:hypothetical protein
LKLTVASIDDIHTNIFSLEMLADNLFSFHIIFLPLFISIEATVEFFVLHDILVFTHLVQNLFQTFLYVNFELNILPDFLFHQFLVRSHHIECPWPVL